MLCNGTVVSVDAQGFCNKPTNGQSVVLLLIVSRARGNNFVHGSTRVQADCDTSVTIRDDFFWGNVSSISLNLPVTTGDILSVRFDPVCTDNCLFQPAIINETSDYELVFYNDLLSPSDPRESLYTLFCNHY